MKRRLLIWYHRVWWAYHNAMKRTTRGYDDRQWHDAWAKWHRLQVDILIARLL